MKKRIILAAAFALLATSGVASPSAAQSACTPTSFQVFFRWNSTEMPPDAEPTVIAALDGARARAREGCRIRSVLVSGHVDTAEIAIGAGERVATARAQGVADIFMRVGAPRNIVHVRSAPGELMMVTNPDVREPMNRNATITITFN